MMMRRTVVWVVSKARQGNSAPHGYVDSKVFTHDKIHCFTFCEVRRYDRCPWVSRFPRRTTVPRIFVFYAEVLGVVSVLAFYLCNIV